MSGAYKLAMFLVGMAASALAVSAAELACPTATEFCQAYFANAYGGPVDCCNADYTKNPICRWSGSPVSFRKTRVCSSAGKQYNVLVPGNSQGPANRLECRCEGPVGTFSPAKYDAPDDGMDVPGQDIPCNGQKFCKVCGGVEKLKAACGAKALLCQSFTFNPADKCGYLKQGMVRYPRKGWVTYTRA